ncbi:MAG: hypothetical protein J3K34DRAFT_521020 [Monoraphidium minutum]|nr:MAG: hypothetical protein J3K34DRAFT_521020 [Monoraphidium minutum]
MVLPVAGALMAAQAGTLGVGFSGAGFLIPFFLGVIDVLQRQLGVLQPDMPMAGGSSGALVTMTVSGLVPLHAMKEEVYRLSDFCSKHGNCYGILQSEVAKAAERLLPPNAAERATAAGNTHVAVTFPDPLGKGPAAQALISNFTSREDMINSLKASVFIPFYAGPSLTVDFRGKGAYDGSFGGPGQGFLPCPPNTGYCIRISSLPAGLALANTALEDVLFGEPGNVRRTLDVAKDIVTKSDLATTLSATLRSFTGRHEAGPANASAAAAAAAGGANGSPLRGQVQHMVDALMRLLTPGEGAADIWPGRRHKLPVTDLFWSSWMISPPNPEQIETIYNLGKAEATSWAEEAGFLPPRQEAGWRAAAAAAPAAPAAAGGAQKARGGFFRLPWRMEQGRRL